MYKLYLLNNFNQSAFGFCEARLVYRERSPEQPRPREAADEAEKLKQKEYRGIIKEILKNSHEERSLKTAEKRGMNSMKTFIKEYLFKYEKITKKTKMIGIAGITDEMVTEYYMNGKRLGLEKDLQNYITNLLNYLKILGPNGRIALVQEAKREADADEKARAQARPAFEENNQWPSQEAADTASKFYTGLLQTICNKARQASYNMTRDGLNPDKLKKSLNKVLDPGVYIQKINDGYGISSDDILMNGQKAWPKINTPAKRAALQKEALKIIS